MKLDKCETQEIRESSETNPNKTFQRSLHRNKVVKKIYDFLSEIKSISIEQLLLPLSEMKIAFEKRALGTS